MTVTTRVRCFRVEIETPPDDTAKSIAYHRERIIEDGAVILGKTEQQPGPLRYPFFPDVVTTIRTVQDPVTGQSVTMSAAGLAAWITADYVERNAIDEATTPSTGEAP